MDNLETFPNFESLLPAPSPELNDRYPEHSHTMPAILAVAGEPLVHLRHVEYTDAGALIKVVERNRDHFNRYLGWTAKADIGTMMVRLENLLYLSSRDEGMAYCIVQGTSQDPGKVIGLTRLFGRYPHWRMKEEQFDLKGPVAHCGTWLDKDMQRQGIAARARAALFQYTKQRWNIENIFMDIAIDNIAAEQSVRAMGAQSMGGGYWQMYRSYNLGKQTPPVPQGYSIDGSNHKIRDD